MKNLSILIVTLFFTSSVYAESIQSQLDRASAEVQAKPSYPFLNKINGHDATAKNVDIDQMIESSKSLNKAAEKETNAVYVFVSLSMPDSILTALSKQAKYAGAVVALRGFKNDDIKATQAVIARVNKGANAQWQIDPDAFKTYKINKVPAVVVSDKPEGVVTTCGGNDGLCADAYNYAIVYGDVSLNESLRRITSSKFKGVAELAQKHLNMLEGRK
jgi:conjugal transfer pilus assembly protein TrbC